MPTRVHAIVLVSKLHKPTLRALAFAKATRPNVLEGVYVAADADVHRPAAAASGTTATWAYRSRCCSRPTARSSSRSSTTPPQIRQANPRGVVAVYIPEYVVGRWWEQLLHNQTALRLKGRLLFTPGVMVTSVPYQLRSSELARGPRGARPEPRPCRRPEARPRRERPRLPRTVRSQRLDELGPTGVARRT